MEINRFIVSASAGAVIGYITNWLAIKMLFRPHEQKKVLGINIPFTPGLIPKEKNRIAESVGGSIGAYLLTKDTMIESLCNDEMISNFRAWITNKIEDIESSDKCINDFLKENLDEKYDEFYDYLVNMVDNYITNNVKDDKNLIKIDEFILEKIDEILKINPSDIVNNDVFNGILENISIKIKEYKNSEELKEALNIYVSLKIKEAIDKEEKLKDIIPEDLVATLKVLVNENKEQICESISGIVKEPSIEEKIKDAIGNILSSKLNPMVAMFVKPDFVYGVIVNFLEEYLNNEENQEHIISLINDKIDSFMENNVEEILKKVGMEKTNNTISKLINLMTQDLINDRVVDSVCISIQNKLCSFGSLKEIIEDINPVIEHEIKGRALLWVHDTIESDKTKTIIRNISEKSTDKILQAKVNEFISNDRKEIKNYIVDTVVDLYIKFIKNKAGEAVEIINIPKIVENKINTFETSYLEKLILDIANKELKAITWLGALLGFVMGIFSQLIAGGI